MGHEPSDRPGERPCATFSRTGVGVLMVHGPARMGAWQAGGRGQDRGPVPTCPGDTEPRVCLPRRSYSIDRSPGAGSLGSPASQRKDLGRSESLRVVCRPHRIFRPSDLIHGEVLGKGCFGQAIKVQGGPGQGRGQRWEWGTGQVRPISPACRNPHWKGHRASRLPGRYFPPPGPP